MNNYAGYNYYYPYYGAANAYTGMQNPNLQQNFTNPYGQQNPNNSQPYQRDFTKNNLNGFDGYYVDNYQDVKNAIVSADGTPAIFISNNEDKFWIKKINSEDGRTIVKSFLFYENIDDDNAQKVNATINNSNVEQPAPTVSQNYLTEQKINEVMQINGALVNKIQELENRLANLEKTKPGKKTNADKGDIKDAAKQFTTNDF